jgi:hypothetical protein
MYPKMASLRYIALLYIDMSTRKHSYRRLPHQLWTFYQEHYTINTGYGNFIAIEILSDFFVTNRIKIITTCDNHVDNHYHETGKL